MCDEGRYDEGRCDEESCVEVMCDKESVYKGDT